MDGGMVVCKMAAVGCTRDSGTLEGEESSEKEGELTKLCRKNGIHQDCFMGEIARDSLDNKVAKIERPQRVNGTLKSVSAIFTKPSIPTLRSRKDKIPAEQSKRRRRLSKEDSTHQRLRCYSQEGGGVLGSGQSDLAACKLDLSCGATMGLSCGLDSGCSCQVNTTQEVCASLSPPHLKPQVPCGEPCKRERRDSNGAVDGRGIPDTPISPLPCLPLPFPKIPSSPQSPTLRHGSNKPVFSTPSSSPISCISSSPAGSLAALDTVSQGNRSQQPMLNGSNHSINNINTNNGSIINSSMGKSASCSGITKSASCSGITKSASCSNLASPSSTKSTPGASSSSKVEESDVLCQWKDCGREVKPGDLLDHLRIDHVDSQKDGERFVCEWVSCKVAGKASCSMSWLERHIVAHGGHKPYRCILPNCGAGFPSQLALQRHVNGHFASQGQSGNGRGNRSRGDDSSSRVVKRRSKVKRRRPQSVRSGDFFDTGIMDELRQQLWDLTEKTQATTAGSCHNVTFHAATKARRIDENGKQSILLQWSPEDVLEETWVDSSQLDSNRQRTIPLSHLPPSSLPLLHPSLYHSHRFRKHRRK